MKIFLPLLVLTGLLVGCAISEEAVLKNDKGEIRYCYKSGGGHPVIANQQFTDCLNTAGNAGFRKVDK